MATEVLERVVPASFIEVGPLRRETNEFVHGEAGRFQDSVSLVVSELCTNAIQALNDPGAEITLRVSDCTSRVVIEVEDDGPGFTEALNRAGAREDSPRGRGLQVVRALVDDFSVLRHLGRTTVRCVLNRA